MKTQPEVYCFKTMYQGVQFLENVNKFLSRKSTEDNDTNHKIIFDTLKLCLWSEIKL